MKNISYYNIDKSTWGEGPWRTEPDKVQWKDQATGYACIINRADHGALCGYVGVPPGHKLHGVYPGDSQVDLWCHGGWNFSSSCQDAPEGYGVCHIPDPGEEDEMWWLGFDCAHSRDIAPMYEVLHTRLGLKLNLEISHLDDAVRSLFTKKYRDLKYVKEAVANLAMQLKKMEQHERYR